MSNEWANQGAASNPAIALGLQPTCPVRRAAEVGR